jgi:hypothetical protein
MFDEENWQAVLVNGFELLSSGTTGEANRIFQPPKNIDTHKNKF